jgi:hypothetical protein
MLLLPIVGCAIDAYYELTPPYTFTNTSEIGNWSIGGSTVNLKSILRIASPAFADSGRACLRVPTLFRDWAIELELSVRCPGALSIVFARDLCAESPIDAGFEISISPDTEPARVALLNGTKECATGRVRLSDPMILRLVRQNNRLIFDSLRYHADERIFETYVDNLLPRGSFAISATLSKGTIDLVSVRLCALSATIFSDEIDFSTVNRKVLRRAALRRPPKSIPLPAVEGGLRGALEILAESGHRLEGRFTREALERFAAATVSQVCEFALKKFRLRADDFRETAGEIAGLAVAVRASMAGMADQVGVQMAHLTEEFEGIARKVSLGADLTVVQADVERRASSARDTVAQVLAVVAAAECVCFFAFFWARKKRTGGFKKRDSAIGTPVIWAMINRHLGAHIRWTI